MFAITTNHPIRGWLCPCMTHIPVNTHVDDCIPLYQSPPEQYPSYTLPAAGGSWTLHTRTNIRRKANTTTGTSINDGQVCYRPGGGGGAKGAQAPPWFWSGPREKPKLEFSPCSEGGPREMLRFEMSTPLSGQSWLRPCYRHSTHSCFIIERVKHAANESAKWFSHAPRVPSTQSLTRQSDPPVARYEPLGLNCKAVSSPSCGVYKKHNTTPRAIRHRSSATTLLI